MSKITVKPLRWVLASSGCWFGETCSEARVVCVYEPGRCFPRRPFKWGVYQYWGANPDRCGHFGEIFNSLTKKRHRFKTLAAAKVGAQRYWRREVLALLTIEK